MLGTQCAHQRVLHQIVRELGVARQRPRIAAQRRDRRLDALAESAHIPLLCADAPLRPYGPCLRTSCEYHRAKSCLSISA